MDLNRVPSRSTTIQFVSIVESHITQGIETNNAGIGIISKPIIDDVVIRRIFINGWDKGRAVPAMQFSNRVVPFLSAG